MGVAQIQAVQFDFDRFSLIGFHVPGLPHYGTGDLSSTLFAITTKQTSTSWNDINSYIYHVHFCNFGPLKRNQLITTRYNETFPLQRVHLCNRRSSYPPAPVAFPLKLSVTALIIRMTLPVVPPIVGVLCRPSVVGISLVRQVCRILGEFLLLPPALALLLAGTIRTVLLVEYLRTRLKKPTTSTATTPFHDHLTGTIRFLSVAQFKASVKEPGKDWKVSGGAKTGASSQAGQFSERRSRFFPHRRRPISSFLILTRNFSSMRQKR